MYTCKNLRAGIPYGLLNSKHIRCCHTRRFFIIGISQTLSFTSEKGRWKWKKRNAISASIKTVLVTLPFPCGRSCRRSQYVKDTDNSTQWIVDDEAAQVVKRIFTLCMDGNGPTQIARILKEEKVLTPTVYQDQKGQAVRCALPDNPYG